MMDRDKYQNRRRHNRRPAYIIVEYTVAEGKFRDILKSVAANGLFINTRRTIAAGQPIALRFPLFSFKELVDVSGRIVRSGPQGFAVQLDRPIDGLKRQNGQPPDIVHEIDRG